MKLNGQLIDGGVGFFFITTLEHNFWDNSLVTSPNSESRLLSSGRGAQPPALPKAARGFLFLQVSMSSAGGMCPSEAMGAMCSFNMCFKHVKKIASFM